MTRKSRRREAPKELERIEIDMNKEDKMRMMEEMHDTAKKMYDRVARKINSGEPMELCEMGSYVDMLKDLAEAMKDLHKASHIEGVRMASEVI